jgi:hypothetical protein
MWKSEERLTSRLNKELGLETRLELCGCEDISAILFPITSAWKLRLTLRDS